MPLDHYVSQVHLKNFYSPALGKRMFALRKRDMKSFTPDAHSVCRVEDGSTNEYLANPRAIEEFLKGIEPRYNQAVANITESKVLPETIYALSGFVAYVLTCSPGGMRIQSQPIKETIQETGRILDRAGKFDQPPPELGGASLSDLLETGKVQVAVDPKYPQALGIESMLEKTNAFGNFAWEVLVNTTSDSPFFTSDLPVAIERTPNPKIINRIVPLTPTLAVRLHPNLLQDTRSKDFSFAGFRRQVRRPSRTEIMQINTLLVRCAETTVFFRDSHDWVHRFVEKNSGFRIEPRTRRIPHGNGTLLWSSLDIGEI